MAQKKKAARRGQTAAEQPTQTAIKEAGANALVGGVYHSGRLYDANKKSDQKAFAALVEKEGLGATHLTDKKERSESHKAALQSLADSGAVRGFGTKASAKKSSDEDDDGPSIQQLTEEQLRERGALDDEDEDEEK